MNEKVGCLAISSVHDAVSRIEWAHPTYMYLERMPHAWHDGRKDAKGICLDFYREGVALDNWQRGRVFDVRQEFKWTWQNDRFHAVYCGPYLPENSTSMALDAITLRDRAYFLWGMPVKKGDRKMLGLQDSQGFYYAELQIPRVMEYPVKGQGAQGRVQVCIREYYDAHGQLVYCRWAGLK